jgi:hypothetical protein
MVVSIELVSLCFLDDGILFLFELELQVVDALKELACKARNTYGSSSAFWRAILTAMVGLDCFSLNSATTAGLRYGDAHP